MIYLVQFFNHALMIELDLAQPLLLQRLDQGQVLGGGPGAGLEGGGG